MKITLITVCWNSASVIRTALESVLSQKGAEIEYLVIDGGSTDGTVGILREYEDKFSARRPTSADQPATFTYRWLSEKDRGMYDALNKGIRMATGDVIGLLNADDVLADDDVLVKIAAAFESAPALDGTYADIRFVRETKEEEPKPSTVQPPTSNLHPLDANRQSLIALRSLPTVRYCSGKRFRPWMFRYGVQTAHPSTFFRKSCFEKWGDYSLDYGMYGDFELLLRFIWKNKAQMRYLPLCTTVMRMGGASTDGWRTTLKINRSDLRAIRNNGFFSCYLFLYSRYIFKIWGFLFRGRRSA